MSACVDHTVASERWLISSLQTRYTLLTKCYLKSSVADPDPDPGAGSGSISQRHGSADPDPDPPQNIMDPQHCLNHWYCKKNTGSNKKTQLFTNTRVNP
jgi:hypothetical protein